MLSFVYFDTDFFHRFSAAFEHRPLAEDLRDRILLSPMTMKEVFSHLAVEWGSDVHRQIKALPNWLSTKAGKLPWMSDAIAWIAFGVPLPTDDDFTRGLEENLNDLLNYELDDVLAAARSIRVQLDKIKTESAGHFKHAVEYFRVHPLSEFDEIWATGIKNRVDVKNAPSTAQIVADLSAYHEFEFSKLQLALANKDYHIEKHRNDLFDAEQLVYMKDPVLHFLTADRGYLRKVVKSPFRDRIHEVPSELLADPDKLETVLRRIVVPPAVAPIALTTTPKSLLKKPLPVAGRSVVRSRDARRRSAFANRDVQLCGVGRTDSSGSSAAWGEEAGAYGLGQNDEGLRWAVLGGGAAIDSA